MAEKKEKIKDIKKEPLWKQYKKNYALVLMVLPGLIALIIFNYFPIYGVTIAFKNYKMTAGITGSPWVGMANFTKLFGNDFLPVLRNTVVISLLKLVCGFPAPIILALMLNEVGNTKYKKLIQTFTYMPHFFSWVVLAGIITMVFSAAGPINDILKFFGAKEPILFFGNGTMFITMVVLTAVWQGIGWGTIVYIAALSGVDEALYEAAVIDGAGRWKQTLYISIPCILPTVATVFILNLGSVLNAGFDQIYNMYNPTVYNVADIIDTYVLRKLQKMDYGVGTAADLFKSVVGLVFVLAGNKLTKKLSDNEMGIM